MWMTRARQRGALVVVLDLFSAGYLDGEKSGKIWLEKDSVTFYWFINELCSITIFLDITIISCWYWFRRFRAKLSTTMWHYTSFSCVKPYMKKYGLWIIPWRQDITCTKRGCHTIVWQPLCTTTAQKFLLQHDIPLSLNFQ